MKTKRLQIAQFIALGATVLSIIGLVLQSKRVESAYIFLGIGTIMTLIAYIFGGFLTALKMSGKIAKVGWIITPFPIDLITFCFTFIFAVAAFLYLPIIPVRKAYKESMY